MKGKQHEQPELPAGLPAHSPQDQGTVGEPELEIYINSLTLMDKPRDGFPPDAFRELNNILDVHRLLFAKCDKPACCAEKRLDQGPHRW